MNTSLADALESPSSFDPPTCVRGSGTSHPTGRKSSLLAQGAGNALLEPSLCSTCVNHESEGHQILVVDDNRDAADSLAQLFGVMGAKVSVAYGAREALMAMTTAPPKIAVIDISMPLMDGYELAARIRACNTFEGVILIALTGWSHAPEADNALTTGFDHLLTKPADLQQLAQLLGSIA